MLRQIQGMCLLGENHFNCCQFVNSLENKEISTFIVGGRIFKIIDSLMSKLFAYYLQMFIVHFFELLLGME